MIQWQVSLSGHTFDLEALERRFSDGAANVVRIGDSYVLKSTEFAELRDSTAVTERADQILRDINGLMRVMLSDYHSVSLGGTERVNSDGTRNVFISISDVVNVRGRVSLTVTRSDGTEVESNVVHADHLLSVCSNNPSLNRAISLISNGDYSWVNLYRVYEVIEKHAGGEERLVAFGWTSKSMIRRFRHTANHPDAIGDDARHGATSSQPPSNPLPHNEAVALIRSLLRNWLKSEVELGASDEAAHAT